MPLYDLGKSPIRYEQHVIDGVTWIVPIYESEPTAAEALDESRPLPRLALYALGWTDEEIDMWNERLDCEGW